jgi:hypothetical protein
MLTLVGAFGLLLAATLQSLRAIPMEILALGLASLAAVGARIAILSYITATSFPAANLHYGSPASPFVITFAAIGTYCGWSALRRGYRN